MTVLFLLLLWVVPAQAGALDDYVARLKSAPVATMIDTRGTFRDLSFGATCSTVPGFQMVQQTSGYTTYGRATDKLSIGTGALKSIRYLCVGDVFRAVLITVPEDSVLAVATAMVGTYGKPSLQENNLAYWRGLKRVAWLGRFEDKGNYILSIGDLPWADPLGLLLTVLSANAQAGQTDL